MEDLGPDAFGVAVFDELEKIQSHLLTSQMDAYFKRTMRGRQRAGRILPEPLFVHSDLTTGVQLADLVAYILSWGWRLRSMARLARPELAGFAAQICQLRHRAVREVAGNPLFTIWSFAFITGLGHVVSEIQRQSLVPLQSGVDIVQAIPKLADRDGSLYPSHGIGARRMPPHPALPEARGAYGFQGIETS